MSIYRCFIIHLLLLVPVVIAGSADTMKALVEWVIKQGGYIHPKQDFREQDGLFGVFAADDIQKGEILASIPWDCIIASNTYGRFKNCDMVRLVAEELNNKDQQSLYAASLQDAARQHASLLPAYWSSQGQKLLLNVTGNDRLPPKDPFMKEFEWKQKCEKVSKEATLLVLTHGEDFGMVPVTDKYNSRGGNWTGAYFSEEDGEDIGLEIRAYRNLKRGEQIFTHYKDYGVVGTPELLRDYGFVEMYPQRFIFHDQGIAFDLEEVGHGDLRIKWLRKVFGISHSVPPTRQSIEFLQREVVRLNGVYSELQRMAKQRNRSVPENELQVVTQLCSAYMTAMDRAIQDVH
jgi:hypothetical protein